jgi:hypothetical protein
MVCRGRLGVRQDVLKLLWVGGVAVVEIVVVLVRVGGSYWGSGSVFRWIPDFNCSRFVFWFCWLCFVMVFVNVVCRLSTMSSI